MNSLSLYYNLLSKVGKLPEEIILRILFDFGGVRHPIVNILLNTTKNYEYELLQNLPFSKSIYKFYLNRERYIDLFNIDIINYTNNKQKNYYKNQFNS